MSSDPEDPQRPGDLPDARGGTGPVRQPKWTPPWWVKTFVPPVATIAGSIVAAIIISTSASRELRNDVAEISAGVASLKTGQTALQISVGTLTSEIDTVQRDLVDIRERVARIDGRIEGINDRIESIEGRIEGIEDRTYPSSVAYTADDW